MDLGRIPGESSSGRGIEVTTSSAIVQWIDGRCMMRGVKDSMDVEVKEEGRCSSRGPRGIRCVMSIGHTSDHASGPFTWCDDSREAVCAPWDERRARAARREGPRPEELMKEEEIYENRQNFQR